MKLFDVAPILFFWWWSGLTSTFTIYLWLGLGDIKLNESQRESLIATAIRVLVSALALGGLFGLASMWALGRGEFDLPNGALMLVGVVCGAFAAHKILRKAIVRKEQLL